ncbi:hypothetical protein XA68_15867 [Ophiocordyceps unilateralis]|uniref:Uncharacterized protein n=1 Tax=Ophiocordyceps unilateralis TaxID=268505 RepID=A0A2A9PT14_OPHUN|nr:hypothetical protein XA68_15867 [Ophiocordyceps unilateralis]
MVSTDLLPESATETRRIYPDRQPEPPPRSGTESGALSWGETMMPPPLPCQRNVGGFGSGSAAGYESSSSSSSSADAAVAAESALAASPASVLGAVFDEPAYHLLDPLQLQPSSPSWLWPNGSWPCEFTIDLPGSPLFPSDGLTWTMSSPLMAHHGYLPSALPPRTPKPWGALPPQAHGYRQDAGAVGPNMMH